MPFRTQGCVPHPVRGGRAQALPAWQTHGSGLGFQLGMIPGSLALTPHTDARGNAAVRGYAIGRQELLVAPPFSLARACRCQQGWGTSCQPACMKPALNPKRRN